MISGSETMRERRKWEYSSPVENNNKVTAKKDYMTLFHAMHALGYTHEI